jgi:peptide/nickel transport system substrate-binding protein
MIGMFSRRAALLGVLPLVAALTGADLHADPARVTVAQTFVAESLDPTDGSAGWALVSHGVAETLFTVDRHGEIVPRLAEAIESRDDGSWVVTLRADRRFSDGTPVTAAEIAAALTRVTDRNPAARASAGRLHATALSDRELLITPERPTPVMASVLAEWPLAIARMTDRGPLFTGPFAVAEFEPGARLLLVPNPHFPDAARRPVVDLRRIADGQALALGLKAGEFDLAFNLPAEALDLLRADPALTVKSFPVAYQYMMWLNTRTPALADSRVRRAIALAIDRDELVKAIRAGQPSRSAYAGYFPFAGEASPARDPAAAAALLDEAGWRVGPDGRRSRAGQPLTLFLWAYPQRPDLVTMQPVLRAQLAAIGIGVETRLTEEPTTTARAGAFDLLLWAQHTAPAGDPAFFLRLFLSPDGANNFAGVDEPRLSKILDRLGEVGEPAARVTLAKEAQAVIAEIVPVVFLVTPEWHVGLSRRLAGYEPWGSDYYVIREDLTVAR